MTASLLVSAPIAAILVAVVTSWMRRAPGRAVRRLLLLNGATAALALAAAGALSLLIAGCGESSPPPPKPQAAAPAPAAPANPLIAQGKKVFDSHACSACHGEGGVGTPMAPQLTGIGGKFTPQQLQDLFQHPTAKMDAGGMPHFQFTPEEMKALIAYLDSLK